MKIHFTICSVFLFLVLHAQKINKAGVLDSSFGINGKVLTSSSFYPLDCSAAAAREDGSIIVSGSTTGLSFFAIKYSADGILDSSFGINGIASVDSVGQAVAIAVQKDDKILVAGYYSEMFEPSKVSIARFNADGTLDLKFGQNGKVINSLGERATAIALQSDGKILIEGSHEGKAFTMRLLENGTTDITFGNNGVVENFYGSGTCIGNAIDIQQDGKIIIGGQAESKLFLGCYNKDGSFDEIFGTGGKVLYDFGSGVDAVRGLKVQPDGKIIAVGSSASYFADTLNGFVFRCLSDGSLDKGFGNGGIGLMSFKTNSNLRSVTLQKDGKIISAGSGTTVTSGGFLVERYLTNGLPDSTFGNNGYQLTILDSINIAYSVFLQKDEKIVLGGAAKAKIVLGPKDLEIALSRYNNDISERQIITAKIRRWLQHHNGFTWDANSNISSYAVQRSYDGIHFNSIARIHAGNTSNYTYHDPMPLSGSNYYRLQTTSADGSVNYSNVLAVSSQPSAISISPNPAKNVLHIEGLSSSNKIKITVVDFSGNVAINNHLLVNGGSSYNLNIASLKPGNYLLKIEMNGEVVSNQFVKE